MIKNIKIACRPYFRHGGRHRRHGVRANVKRGRQLRDSNKPHISQRPTAAEQRLEIGHYEGDTMVGYRKRSYLITLVDRLSKYTLAAIMPAGGKNLFAEGCIDLYQTVKPQYCKTLTLDNGAEMNDYQVIKHQAQIDIYFADPYSSYQRGLNENTNGLIRQYLPKGTSLQSNHTRTTCKNRSRD